MSLEGWLVPGILSEFAHPYDPLQLQADVSSLNQEKAFNAFVLGLGPLPQFRDTRKNPS